MTSGDAYRAKAAELHSKAQQENDGTVAAELEGLARGYLRLALEADRNDADQRARPPRRQDQFD